MTQRSRNRSARPLLLLALSMMALAGCGSHADPAANTTPPPSAKAQPETVNPAKATGAAAPGASGTQGVAQ